MLRILRDQIVYSMSASNPPVARCPSESTVVFETDDAYTGFLQSEEQVFSAVKDIFPSEFNPATGPLYVEDAEPGDILRVEILDIVLGEHGAMCQAPGILTFGDVLQEERTPIMPVKDGKLYFNEKITLDTTPMIGVIGTAPKPEDGAITNSSPGGHGANMDCTRIRKGAVVYLPVNVPGALLCIGDLHAAMGDGESCGQGAEIPGEVMVKIDVVKGVSIPLPMILEGPDVMVIASDDSLEKASNQALHLMHRFLHETAGFSGPDAACLISLVGQLQICQIVNPLYTVRVTFPLSVLEQNDYHFTL